MIRGQVEQMYFQFARGRAMVVSRSLRRARAAKRAWQDPSADVARARRALREWREYRRRMAQAREAGI